MEHETIEEFVIRYYRRYRIPSQYKTGSKSFERASYRKHAAREMLTYIRFHRDLHPIMAIEEYSKKMYEYAARGGKGSYMFNVAGDTAEDILCKLRQDRNRYFLY